MKPAAFFDSVEARFDALSLRERLLAGAALVGVCVYLWDAWLMEPLASRGQTVQRAAELLRDGAAPGLNTAGIEGALGREHALRAELDRVESALAAEAAGLIEPQRMVEVVRGVLDGQRDLVLVSLRNLPARPLLAAEGSDAVETGPYVHTVELIVEGSYFATLDYLRALEALPWRFYWRSLRVETLEHPLQRVRIELATLSPRREWLGV